MGEIPRAEGDVSEDLCDAKDGTFGYGVNAAAYSLLEKRVSKEIASVFIISVVSVGEKDVASCSGRLLNFMW